VLAGGVAAAFGFYRADDDGVKECAGADSGLARGIEIAPAGGFAGIGDHNDDAAAVFAALVQRVGAEHNGVIDRSARARRDFAHGFLEGGNVVREGRDLRDVFIESENREAVAGAENLADEVRGGLLFEGNFLVRAEAGVDHEREIERLLGFGLEDFDFLLHAFFKELKGLDGQVRRRAIVLVQNAGEHIDEVHIDADFAAILRRVWGWVRTVIAGVDGSGRGRVGRGGSRARRLRPGRPIGLVLRQSIASQDNSGDQEEASNVGWPHGHERLRCRFCSWGFHGHGRKFAVGPDSAVLEILLFPDGNGALESVNGEAAGIEGRGAMRGADGDEDARFADLEPAEAVNDGDTMDRKSRVHLGGDFADFSESHRLVRFVVEVERWASVRLIANATVEGNDGAVFTGADVADEGSRVDGLDDEKKHVIVEPGHRGRLASADRWKEGDFIAGVERSAPSGEFAIAGSDQRGAETGQLGMASAIVGEELLDARAVGEIGKIFCAADDIFKAAEEKHFDAHGLRSAWHRGIVTRAHAGGQWHGLGCSEE